MSLKHWALHTANKLFCSSSSSENSRKTSKHSCQSQSHKVTFNTISKQLGPVLQILKVGLAYPIALEKFVSGSTSKLRDTKGKDFIREGSFSERDETQVDTLALSSKSNEISKSVNYEEECSKWKFKVTLFFVLYKGLSLFVTIMYLFNIAFDIPFPFRMFSFGPNFRQLASLTSQKYNSASLAIMTGLKVMAFPVVLWNLKDLVCWINNWSEFERDFSNSFKKPSGGGDVFLSSDSVFEFNFNIRFYRNLTCIGYLVIPGIVWLGGGSFALFPLYEYHVPYFGRFSMALAGLAVWGYSLAEDCLAILILKTSALVIEQIRLGVKHNAKTSNVLTPLDVINYRNLVEKSRQQAALASNYLKSQQMIFVAETILSGSLSISFLFEFIHDGSFTSSTGNIGIFVASMYTCLSNFGRLYFKVLHAEKVPAEELLIAGDILQIEGKCGENDINTKAELKFLYNMLTQKTVAINLGNYFCLDKKLILQVGIQVVTYLIVIIQFQGSSTVNNCDCGQLSQNPSL